MSNIQPLNTQQVYGAAADTKVAAENTQAASQPIVDEADIVEISGDTKAADTTKQVYTRDTARVNYLKAAAENNANALREMVSSLLTSQGLASQGNWGQAQDIWSATDHDLLTSLGLQMGEDGLYKLGVEADAATRDKAAGMIAEDGPLGVEQMSESIVGFAKALSGGDPAKIDMLKKAVEKGFEQAAAYFGGMDKMPEITQKTYDAVMKGFEAWKNGDASPAAEDGE